MEEEINSLTKMIFGLAKSPSSWIRAYEFQPPFGEFHTKFGALDTDGCEWDLWWHEQVFKTRCLVYKDVDGERVIVCAYGDASHEPHTSHRRSWESPGPMYPSLGVAGVLLTYRYLDVFVKGMLHDFPLGIKVEPFLEAAELEF